MFMADLNQQINDLTKQLTHWINSLSDFQKYGLIAMVVGVLLLVLAIILW